MKGLEFMTSMAAAIRKGTKTETRRLHPKLRYHSGERVYVKETTYVAKADGAMPLNAINIFIFPEEYRVDPAKWKAVGYRFRQARFMPFAVARTQLLIIDAYQEPLQCMTDQAARAEGFESLDAFRAEWDKVYPDKSWQSNPTVSVYKFVSEPL
jgi:hypothetical protein